MGAKREPKKLSPRMSQLVNAVASLTKEHGYPPSICELASEIKSSKGRAYALSIEAERRGYLTRNRNVHRSMKVVDPSEVE